VSVRASCRVMPSSVPRRGSTRVARSVGPVGAP